MNSGSPLVLSGNQAKLLSLVSNEADSAAKYQESFLQETIDRWPNVLPIQDFYPNAEGLRSLGREVPVDLGEGEGKIDNLLVTSDGHLVIVETKLWRNPESLRKVVAQTLQYGMAVSQLPWDEFEERLRHSHAQGRRLGKDETVFEFLKNVTQANPLQCLDEDFEDNFDRWRRDGEILFLIVADAIRPSVERLVHWMNGTVGSRPYQLGLVELRLYDLPDVGQFIVPKTLLRIREGSRHVVTVNIQTTGAETVTTTVTGEGPVIKVPPADSMTEEALTKKIHEQNTADVAQLADAFRSGLRKLGLVSRGLPASVQYGIEMGGDFIRLITTAVPCFWFQLPMRAVRALGDERFLACKRKINDLVPMYRAGDVDDPSKAIPLNPRYRLLEGRVEDLVNAVAEIAAIVRTAVAGES